MGFAGGHTLQFREQVNGANGMRQLSIFKSPLYDLDGAVLGTMGIGRDRCCTYRQEA